MFSSHFNAWLPAKVKAVHSDGHVDVEAKIHKSIQASEVNSALRIPVQQPNTAQQSKITIKFQSGQQIWDDGWKCVQILPSGKVKDLLVQLGLNPNCLPPRSILPDGKPKGVMQLNGPGASLDLDNPMNFEKLVSELNLSEGCHLELLYGFR